MSELNFVQVIKACEEAGGAGTKKIIQAALAQANATARRLISEALNPYRVFGVKKFDMPSSWAKCTDMQHDYEPFFQLLDKLHNRELTGNAAREAVTSVLSSFNHDTQIYLTRVIDKDLKAGFSADTFNKVWPTEKIPTFELMLADKCDSIEDFEQYITFPCQADFKYDGIRFLVTVTKDQIIFRNRSGKTEDTVTGLFDADLFKLHEHLGYDYVLDGERISDLGFTDTMNAKKDGNDAAKKNLRIRAFFLMPLEDWMKQETSISMEQNREFLSTVLNELKLEKILLTEGRVVNDYDDMTSFCNEAIDKPENKARKIEGLILKNLKSVYQWDRTIDWCKVKRFYDVDCRVIGFYNGRPKSRLEKTLGGITVMGYDEHGTKVVTNVGSGFSDALREEIWNNQAEWLGRTVVIKYQEISKAKNKEDASLRFPTYERWRDDKVVE